MASTITVYNSLKLFLLDGTLDLNTNTFKVTLHSSAYTPNAATHSVLAHTTGELATANGYTNGGKLLVNPSLTNSLGTVKWNADNLVWTASSGSIVARYAVISAIGTLNGTTNPLIAYITLNDNGGAQDVTVTDGNTLTLQWNTNGILTLT